MLNIEKKNEINLLSKKIIGAAIEVHRNFGPGLMENIYEECLCHELDLKGINYERQKQIPLFYKGRQLNLCYRTDLIVEKQIVVELKMVDQISPIHEAQLLTYLKL
ncbi:MAG TPA: GxxExxY protein, partial [Clostridia bacterium]|nr:GxxExxY protein [Clostridia bacterium]